VFSLSKIKNVDKLTSESSSSRRLMTGGDAVPCDDAFGVGSTAADALPAIAKDTPAAPHTGKAVLERFRLEVCFMRAMAEPRVCVNKY
jgi:hypothetical protein